MDEQHEVNQEPSPEQRPESDRQCKPSSIPPPPVHVILSQPRPKSQGARVAWIIILIIAGIIVVIPLLLLGACMLIYTFS